ncbi:MAG: nucleotidyltransferase domain-containing protein [Candidatus Moraniibacteriota bacterium]
MDTETLFQDFERKNRQEISELVKKFVVDDLFIAVPDLMKTASIIVTGSVANGTYDKDSDIDLTIIFYDEEGLLNGRGPLLNEFKGENLKTKKKPIELHGQSIVWFDRLHDDMKSWKKDWLLAEMKDALIIYDPENKIRLLQDEFDWYPDEIYREKMRWLFAEATFLLFDRYSIAMGRKSVYYSEMTKLKIVGHFMSCLLMLDRRYPKSVKHLQKDILKIEHIPSEIIRCIDEVLVEREFGKIFDSLRLGRSMIEDILINRSLIRKESEEYWAGFRSEYMVEIEN